MKRVVIIWLSIFSIAMGYMESAVVIYLRKIYYPEGFKFPLVPMDMNIALVEIFREVATIIMLVGVGILSARTTSTKFATFLWCFAIWDVFYYLFLWIFLEWPTSIFTSDILFLIPVPWVGPVLTPCIVSFTMMVLASVLFHFDYLEVSTKLKSKEWTFLIVGSFIVIVSFMWDYIKFSTSNITTIPTNSQLQTTEVLTETIQYIPGNFNWPLFACGELIICCGILLIIMRMNKKVSKINDTFYSTGVAPWDL